MIFFVSYLKTTKKNSIDQWTVRGYLPLNYRIILIINKINNYYKFFLLTTLRWITMKCVIYIFLIVNSFIISINKHLSRRTDIAEQLLLHLHQTKPRMSDNRHRKHTLRCSVNKTELHVPDLLYLSTTPIPTFLYL